ncbi:MAG: YraN family protein [Gordonibacter sp.]|nr:YraN family protein [Gordonibacter sp.]
MDQHSMAAQEWLAGRTIGAQDEEECSTPAEDKVQPLKKQIEPARSSKRHNVDLGRRGEDAAVRFLDRRGYDILERNWTCVAGEADIIARDDDTLVFIEVKTRSSIEKGLPSEAVDKTKRQRYERIAAHFLQNYEVTDVIVRFDVISLVTVSPDRALVRHHINAFAVG